MLRPRADVTRARIISIISVISLSFLVGVIGIILQLMHNAAGNTWVSDTANTVFIAMFFLNGLYILVAAGLTIARKPDIVKGLGFGTCFSIVLTIIEFALLEWLGGV